MNTAREDCDDAVETQLARLQPRPAIGSLRQVTLGRVQRELRSSRWDRRLGRIAAMLLVLGIGMNVATINQRMLWPTDGHVTARPTTESIAELADSIAEATDIETAAIVARQMAAFNGFPLGSRQADAVEDEIDLGLPSAVSDGKEG